MELSCCSNLQLIPAEHLELPPCDSDLLVGGALLRVTHVSARRVTPVQTNREPFTNLFEERIIKLIRQMPCVPGRCCRTLASTSCSKFTSGPLAQDVHHSVIPQSHVVVKMYTLSTHNPQQRPRQRSYNLLHVESDGGGTAISSSLTQLPDAASRIIRVAGSAFRAAVRDDRPGQVHSRHVAALRPAPSRDQLGSSARLHIFVNVPAAAQPKCMAIG
jgi:hypothetical protein